jgi:hypothetical protein
VKAYSGVLFFDFAVLSFDKQHTRKNLTSTGFDEGGVG